MYTIFHIECNIIFIQIIVNNVSENKNKKWTINNLCII